MKLLARVPATSANLGPGFDCFGLALDLVNEVHVDTEGDPGVSWEGEGADELPTDGSDMVSTAMRFVAEREAATGRCGPLPPVRLHGVNRIPLERGLGSSSAAAVAGAALARSLLGLPRNPFTVFSEAFELEGHPDNAAAAVYGGLTVIADGHVRRLDVHPSLRPVALVPEHIRLPTEQARRALPSEVPLGDAVYNVAHGALAVLALTTGDADLLFVALRDRLHEDVRLSLLPEVRDVADRLRRAQVPVCLSGAGPTLLAFDRREPVPDPGEGWRTLRIPVRGTGIEILER